MRAWRRKDYVPHASGPAAGLPPVDDQPPSAAPERDQQTQLTQITATTDFHQEIRKVVVVVVVASRLVTGVMVALGALGGIQAHAYTRLGPALLIYGVALAWGLAFVVIALRSGRVPDWVLAVDTGVLALSASLLPWFARTEAFEAVSNPDLEPLAVSVAVAVALVSGSGRATAATCTCLTAAYFLALAPFGFDLEHVAAALNVAAWQAGSGYCGWVFIRRLRAAASLAESATAQMVAARELLATQRAHADERLRQGRDRVRRYRALHDGPLRILTAVAGAGPAGHPDPWVRQQCAVSVNVLRGTTSDEDGVPLTDLSLALIEAGNEIAAFGLRVEYHFAGLPEGVPSPVVSALRLACAEALHNVGQHADVTRAWLTGSADGDPLRPTVRVAVVDQGVGFDPATVDHGHGIRRSILQRMAEVGGAATIDSHPGEGTRIDLRWPA